MASNLAIIVNQEGIVQQTNGKLEKILGYSPGSLTGKSLLDLCVGQGRADLAANIIGSDADAPASRDIALKHASSGYIRFAVSPAAVHGEAVRLEFGRPQRSAAEVGKPAVCGEEEFFDFVGDAMAAQGAQVPDLMMIELAALGDAAVASRLGKDGVRQFRQAVETTMESHASGGRIGRLDKTSYGLLGKAGASHETVTAKLLETAAKHEVSEIELAMRSQTVMLDQPDLDRATLKRSLSHAKNTFKGRIVGGFGKKKPGAPASLAQTTRHLEDSVDQIRRAIEEDRIALARRSVVRIGADLEQISLALGQVEIDSSLTFASQHIILENEPRLAAAHDLAMIDRAALETTTARADGHEPVPTVININQASLTQSTFVRDINDVIGRYALAVPEIGLRVSGLDINDKGSKAARALGALSRQGHPVWLDHFTGAISGLPSLDARHGGYVEVPGTYLKRIASSQDGRELITRLFNLWREANFHIIVTNASQEDTLAFVSKLGVTLVLAAA